MCKLSSVSSRCWRWHDTTNKYVCNCVLKTAAAGNVCCCCQPILFLAHRHASWIQLENWQRHSQRVKWKLNQQLSIYRPVKSRHLHSGFVSCFYVQCFKSCAFIPPAVLCRQHICNWSKLKTKLNNYRHSSHARGSPYSYIISSIHCTTDCNCIIHWLYSIVQSTFRRPFLWSYNLWKLALK